MKLYNMITKKFVNIPKWKMTPNHLMVLESTEDANFIAGLSSAGNRIWSYCIIEIMKSDRGNLAVCAMDKLSQDIYFECLTCSEEQIVEKFLNKVGGEEVQFKRTEVMTWTQEEQDAKLKQGKT